MDFQLAKSHQAKLRARLDTASAVIRQFPANGPMGLTADEVKFSPAFRLAKKEFDAAFATLRAFNLRFTKAFANELRAERRTRRAG